MISISREFTMLAVQMLEWF